MTNPLLQNWTTPFQVPPFDQITDDDFAPAFEAALAEARAEVDAIANNPASADFANTIEALERTGKTLSKVLAAFFSVSGADSNPKRQELQRAFSPKLAAYSSDFFANKALFDRVAAIWEARDQLDLSPEQARLLMLTHRSFRRAGAALTGDEAARMRQIMQRLAELGTAFTQNLLADEAGWSMALTEDDLIGLPDFLITAAQEAGREAGASGPVITLARSLVVPFLQFSPRRDLREKAFRAWAARGANGGATDNRDIAAETLKLRQERAQLLGYDSFAAFKLETEMAGDPAAVRALLQQVWTPAVTRARADEAALTEMLRADGINGALEPWDWRYYAEKRRMSEFDLDEAALKPYLQLDRMIAAAFDCAHRLFGLSFTPTDVPLYHPDCRAWEVTRDGQHVAIFIGDYFARASKRSGAWCSSMRGQAKYPDIQGPIVVNVCNFAKGSPALLSYDDARTLFHEFGHALHHLLSNVTYESMSGTSVARDFVELPSQLFEHWLEVPEVLSTFATHVDTGAPMPRAMLDNLLAAATYDMGFQTVEYLASAFVDLDFHSGSPPSDVMARQAQILADLDCPTAIPMRHATPQFAHVFSGDGYSSGYYSYLWSEVMDADAFEAFEDAGDAFSPSIAAKLESAILSTGGTRDPKELYTEFRGKMPDVTALLRGRGLIA